MKKFFALLMTFMLILATGCGSQDNDNQTSDDDNKLKVGTIKYMNVSEALIDKYLGKSLERIAKTSSSIRAPKHVFFDNMTSMLAGLQAGQIDSLSTYESVGNYLISQNPLLEIVTQNVPDISDNFCCAMRESDEDLKKEFDDAILKLTADGTLKKLAEEYITDVNFDDLPSVEMPKFDGAPTIKVAVTGDLPPLDYVNPDGQPAGFNTAVLAAISQEIGKNFKLVDIDSGARAIALISKQVDVVFWVAVPLDKTIIPEDFDKPKGIILTSHYFNDDIVYVHNKNEVTE